MIFRRIRFVPVEKTLEKKILKEFKIQLIAFMIRLKKVWKICEDFEESKLFSKIQKKRIK